MRRRISTRRRSSADGQTANGGAPAAQGARRPLVAALVPDPDVWRVSGAGRTLVARRRADGRIAWASIVFDLKHPTNLTFFGSGETEEGAFEEILDALYRIEDALPMMGGSASLAARFAHGALAHARAADPAVSADPALLSVFGDARGSEEQQRRALTGEDGLCSKELVTRCEQEANAELAPGESLAVHVAMAFRAASPEELGRAIACDPDFTVEKGGLAWRPARGNKQKLGSVYLEGDAVEAETVSLDLAGHLCGRLKRLAQGGLELLQVEHRPLD
ncbi:MAG TPA: hypothetical protein VFF73_35755 [Planctomycetota bacterium]|nr:hypothetical protein [Planctomycetota bacterium]